MAVTIAGAHVILCVCLFSAVHGIRVSNKTYVEINGVAACFRRFNATHQVGCNSKSSGSVGVVYYVESSDDIDFIVNKATQSPYAILMGPTLFTLSNVQKLWNSGKINGMMVIHVLDNETMTPIPDHFSPDTTCPNDQYGLYHGNSDYGNCKHGDWNPDGNNMMFQDYAFPIFVLKNETEVDILIHECFERFNKPLAGGPPRDYPLCAVELKDSMSGAKDTVTCVRRNNKQVSLDPETYCDPMGDDNIIAPLKGVSSTEDYPDNSVIVAAARMDSFSMFENVYPSADNHVTGIVALLAVAEAIGKVKDRIIARNDTKDIMFTFFQGEAFDYIGSGRMVYDMQKNQFPQQPLSGETHIHPISLQHISHFVEINQLGYRDEGKLWIHTDPISMDSSKNISDEINEMIQTITRIASNVSVGIGTAQSSQPLPPSSVQSFLKKRMFPALVITDHKQGYTNKYYNSRFDTASEIQANSTDSDNITQQARDLTEVATMLARSLFVMATGEDDALVKADVNSVNDMLHCFLVNRNCELFQQIIEEDDVKSLMESPTPYPFYVSVTSTENHVTSLTKLLLSRYTGDVMENTTEKNCNVPDKYKVYSYTWMQGPFAAGSDTKRDGHCWRSTVNLSTAKSPAFDITDYDWYSGEFSTWTESSWKIDAINVRMFLIPSKQMETTILSAGVVLTLLSLMVGYFISEKADIIFSQKRTSRYYSY